MADTARCAVASATATPTAGSLVWAPTWVEPSKLVIAAGAHPDDADQTPRRSQAAAWPAFATSLQDVLFRWANPAAVVDERRVAAAWRHRHHRGSGFFKRSIPMKAFTR
jgi:hypothetical protein